MSKTQKKTITTTYLPDTTMKRLKLFAVKTDRSISDVMDKAVNQYVSEKPKKKI